MSNHSKNSISFHNTKFRIPFHGSATSANGNSKQHVDSNFRNPALTESDSKLFDFRFQTLTRKPFPVDNTLELIIPTFLAAPYIPNSVLPEFLHGGSIHTCFPTESFGSFQLNSHVLIRFSKQRDFRGVLTFQINATLTKNK